MQAEVERQVARAEEARLHQQQQIQAEAERQAAHAEEARLHQQQIQQQQMQAEAEHQARYAEAQRAFERERERDLIQWQREQVEREREAQNGIEEQLRNAQQRLFNEELQQHHEDERRSQRLIQSQRQEQQDEPAREPAGHHGYAEPLARHNMGPMNVVCPNCKALHFDCEKLSKSSRRNPKFGDCCLTGQIDLPRLEAFPQELQRLYEDPQDSRSFRKNIRQYNAALSFTSLGVNIDRQMEQRGGISSFKIHGELCHRMGTLLPEEGEQPTYAQLYIYDPAEATNIRHQRNSELSHAIFAEIQDVLHRHHPYVNLYKQAHRVMAEVPAEQRTGISCRLHFIEGSDGRTYNLPTADEIAVVIPGDGSEEVSDKRDIVLRLQGGGLRRISQLSHAYSPLHYVLLFPRGEDGWHINIPAQRNAEDNLAAEKVTQRKFYAYRLFP
ncbi:hypothetical protein BJ138DRAFT_1021123, partial [Hygrophoropsis aurantiaca]